MARLSNQGNWRFIVIYITLYIVLVAISTVAVHRLADDLPTMLMVGLSTVYAILFFNLINIKTIGGVYRKLLNNKRLFAAILISVTIVWVGSFYVPIYYGPANHLFTYMSLTSIYGSFFSYRKSKQPIEIIKAMMLLIILSLFYILSFSRYSLGNFLIMLGATWVTATAGYIYIIKSSQLNQHKCTATEVLAIRYWLLLAITLFPIIKDKQYLAINLTMMGEIFILSVIMLITPIYFFQKSIEKMGGNFSAVMIGLTPCATFILEKIVLKTETTFIGYLSIALASVIMLSYIFSQISFFKSGTEVST
jgi:hypothetical protein